MQKYFKVNVIECFIISIKKRKIREFPGIKSELAKLFGYESDGHFYYDWNTLLNEGLLAGKEGFIKIKKGMGEFKLLATIQIAMMFSLMFGLLPLLVSFFPLSYYRLVSYY